MRWAVPGVLMWVAACDEPLDHEVSDGEGDPRVIYGNDDRLDLYQVSDPEQLALADSVVMFASPGSVSALPGGGWEVSPATSDTLCPEEPFSYQPDPGWCSGVLVGPDLVLTAGHCVTSKSCRSGGAVIVAGFSMLDAETPNLVLGDGDVARCVGIVRRVQKRGVDFAVIRLNHPLDHEVATVSDGVPAVGEPTLMIGHPWGLPVKVEDGGTVKSIGKGFLSTNVDAYAGNSGSAIFRPDGTVGSLLVRGNPDFTYDAERDCYVSIVCSDETGCGGTFEEATLAYLALGAI